jgi:assimilatory nitrate reductase catalytic subunit
MSNTSIKTTCPYCGVGCGMEVIVDHRLGEIAVSVRGDKQHPANQGRLCVKGSSAGETIDFNGRLTTPKVQGKAISIDDALVLVATRFKEIIRRYGPDSVAFYGSGQLLTEDYYVANKLMKGYIGSGNIDTNSRLCMSSAVAGYKRAFGSDTVPCSYEDLEQADLIVLVGSNTAWAHPIVYQRIAAAKKSRPGMKIVVVDPRQTATCDLADLHLPIEPGMDALLYNGLLTALEKANKLNHEFISAHTEGFEVALDKARETADDLHKVAAACALDVEDLKRFYQWIIETEKTVTLYSQGVNQSTSGVDKSNAIINAHLATGRIGKPGMGPFSITGQPNAMGGREVGGLANMLAAHMDFDEAPCDRVQRFWGSPTIATSPGKKAVDMFQALQRGDIKAIWIMNTNPVDSMPDADFVREALKKADFVVVSDCMEHTDTTACADVVLPALTWGETDGMVTNSDRTISRQRKFIDGPAHARPDWWWICQVAQRMGFEGFDYDQPWQIFKEYAAQTCFENNGERDLRIELPHDFDQAAYDTWTPAPWPITAEHPDGTPRMFADGHFFTPDGKARFIAIEPQPPQNSPSAQYPYRLNTGRLRDQWHTMTRTGKTPRLFAHRSEPFVQIHPDNAHDLQSGELVRLYNDLGEIVVRAEITDTVQPNQLFAPMHWTEQFASNPRVDKLVPPYTDPISGQPELKHAVVNLESWGAQQYGFVLSRDPIDTKAFGYWAKILGPHFIRYEVANREPANFDALLETLAPEKADLIELRDPTSGHYRAAWLVNGRLERVLFLSPGLDLPTRNWLSDCFTTSELTSSDRRTLLAGQPSNAKDPGPTICACFGVGLNTIIEAIHEQNLTSVEAIGKALRAGTNCGSCVPELTEILTHKLKRERQ